MVVDRQILTIITSFRQCEVKREYKDPEKVTILPCYARACYICRACGKLLCYVHNHKFQENIHLCFDCKQIFVNEGAMWNNQTPPEVRRSQQKE